MSELQTDRFFEALPYMGTTVWREEEVGCQDKEGALEGCVVSDGKRTRPARHGPGLHH